MVLGTRDPLDMGCLHPVGERFPELLVPFWVGVTDACDLGGLGYVLMPRESIQTL